MNQQDSTPASLTQYFDLDHPNACATNTPNRHDTGWSSITRVRTARTTSAPPDIFDLLGSISTPARTLFLEIKTHMDYKTYRACLDHKTLTRSQKNHRSKAITELANTGEGLARRVPTNGIVSREGLAMRFRPSTFMLTPDYIFPCKYFADDIHFIWEQCAK
jgi:hypothetical protein